MSNSSSEYVENEAKPESEVVTDETLNKPHIVVYDELYEKNKGEHCFTLAYTLDFKFLSFPKTVE